jgi:hypothetical protein
MCAEKERLTEELVQVNAVLATSMDDIRELLLDIATLQPLGPTEDEVRPP